ncbi:TorF family putative porin [Oleiharenicola lentus]|uniref:TorF family putative porin n=1 Tax=Oleiharenicola lentus TaxID=2508720 RepID=UPI003F674A5A
MIKSRILPLLLACTLTAPFIAQAQLTGSVEVGANSRYDFRGIKRENSNVEASLRLNHGNFYGNLWTMHPSDSHSLREYNVAAGYQSDLETQWAGRTISYDVGAIFYDYPDPSRTPFRLRDTFEVYAGVHAPLAQNLAGSVYVYYDFRLEAVTTEGALGYGIPFGELPLSLNLSGFLGYTDAKNFQAYGGYRGADSYTYYGFSAEVPWRLERVTITGGAQYGDSIGLRGGKRAFDTTDALWWFAKVGYKF